MLNFGFPDHSLAQNLFQLQYQSFQSEFDWIIHLRLELLQFQIFILVLIQ